jgi:hypothetical protein
MSSGHPNTPPGGLRALISSRAILLALLMAIGISLGLVALAAQRAGADFQGPDENASEAFGPIQGAHTYSAMLNNNGSNPDDQDWYFFYVPAAGDHLHFTIKNSSPKCTPHPQSYYCHVYATLENSSGNQVGGSNSSAGTSGALPGQTQYINWTFTSPGKYYIAFIGDGDQLNYRFSVTPACGVSSRPSFPPLDLTAHQQRRNVDISLTNPCAGSKLLAHLYAGTGSSRYVAGTLQRSGIPKGDVHHAIQLDSRAWKALKKRHRLRVAVQVVLTLSSGQVLRGSHKLLLTH